MAGTTIPNAVGMLTAEWTQAHACSASRSGIPASSLNWKQILSYDSMGRVLKEQQCTVAPCSSTPGAIGTLERTYNFVGSVTSLTNGAGTVGNFGVGVTSGFDGASRLTSVTSSYDTDQGHPHTLFLADGQQAQPSYGPFGLTHAQLGVPQSSSSPLLIRAREYDNPGRVIRDTYQGAAVAAYGSQLPATQHATVLSLTPNPIPAGVTAIATTACDASCSSGNSGMFVDGTLRGRFCL